MVNILGISAFYHDSAAWLIQDEEIIAAAQEERFTRKKHDSSFPKQAIVYCLKEGKISERELDYVAFYDKPFIKFERIVETYLAYAPRGLKSYLLALPLWLKEKLLMTDLIRKELDGYKGEIIFPEHHESKHTIKEVLNWFEQTGFQFVKSLSKTGFFGGISENEKLFEPESPANLFKLFWLEKAMMFKASKNGGLFIVVGQKKSYGIGEELLKSDS
jgi:hypothetical protein